MRYTYFPVILIAILLFTACGINNYESEPTTDHVLTILARRSYEGPIRQAERNLIAEWEQRPEKYGHTFRVELTTFWPDEEIDVLTRLAMMLMAGQAYDIFFPIEDHRHVRAYAQPGFLTDIYPLMRNCPRTNIEEDFFTNALDAWKMDGGLYVMPWHFGFSYAFVNTALPQSILNRFTALDSITVAELVDMYRHLLRYYAHDFEHFSFSHGGTLHSPSKIVASHMGNFIDFDNHRAYLTDDAFIGFLVDFATAFAGQRLHGYERQYWTNWWMGWTRYAAFQNHNLRMIAGGANAFTWSTPWARSYVRNGSEEKRTMTMQPHAFIVESRALYPSSAVIHLEALLPYFTHGIPLVDDKGRLLIADNSAYPAGVAISAAADSTVAWDFTRHLIRAFNKREGFGTNFPFYNNSLEIPIVRDLLEFRLSANIYNAYSHYIGWNMFPCIFYRAGIFAYHAEYLVSYIPAMVQQMAVLAEQPVALARPPVPDFLYENNLDLLLRGLITPRDFVQRTQNAVTLWLLGG